MTTVGITAGATRSQFAVSRHFVDAVLEAGGTPVLVPTSHGHHRALLRTVASVDALLVSSGGDIGPSLYGAATEATLDSVDLARDSLEILAVRTAIAQGIRVLGVCRGAELMAVATGGTLVQDLPAHGFPPHLATGHDRETAQLTHSVKVDPDSLAHRVIGKCDAVNSHHHQAISHPGKILVPSAWSEDGVIEAVEAERMLGVQWHPEIMHAHSGEHLGVFQWLVSGDRGLER
ncbi:type 1 glutamine amidotransferase [Yinghuangia sp. ASG 101]|uniref:gamma-glutamyl-gamma-aminobutyrate hydrolase family protein n=1 Tax=Yinghuangia sp. ASG 101 TaxID=2896848 RepID=UPI001E4D8923|nr:type 1 glutamine amidotransferase [Yinghuangia sp. ASG 101]UGQ12023.1 type 1 glutamine amidotransferase [Yinghuangia sp. ASG 101]